MTKDESVNLCRYYIIKAVGSQGTACASVERKDECWTVKDCFNVKERNTRLKERLKGEI